MSDHGPTPHLDAVVRERDEARRACADLGMEAARLHIALLRREPLAWVVARDGGRQCERCEGEVRRGEAYEEQPGTGGLIVHIHCPRPERELDLVRAELASALVELDHLRAERDAAYDAVLPANPPANRG